MSNIREHTVRVRLKLGGKKIVVKIHDNATSKDFLALLPSTLKLSDYASTEKVSPLPKKLSTKDAPCPLKRIRPTARF